ncbi:hypothetical protein CH300_10220 [Rhodococcus sp. 15-1154-1]|nr:hypothetical protein [Rhodococcus sp. 15-1154-1]OZF06421.1 hypothetical protein CH300_10220 [Rhodococcus sp. 15-1154-1]
MSDPDDPQRGRNLEYCGQPLTIAQALTAWTRHLDYERALMRSPLAEQLRAVEDRIQEMMREQHVTDPEQLSASSPHSLSLGGSDA